MNSQWKMVPVIPTEEMLEAGDNCGNAAPEAYWSEMLAAAPVPPAGDAFVKPTLLKETNVGYAASSGGSVPPASHVEVLASLGLTLAVLREAFNAPDRTERVANMDVGALTCRAMADFDQLRAHVTRLKAEVERWQQAYRNEAQTGTVLISERNQMVEKLADAEECYRSAAQRADLYGEALKLTSDELTKAREALAGMVEYFPEGHSDGECFSVEQAKAVLAHQSAPAAKGEESTVNGLTDEEWQDRDDRDWQELEREE